MKTFTNLLEHCTTADVNPGNAIGVTNHLTPVDNIITNVRNLFATHLGIVASKAEDGVSVKLNSTKFVNKEAVNAALYNPIYNDQTSLATYIKSQGLDLIKMINLGMYWVVYFSPRDIATAMPAVEPAQAEWPVDSQCDACACTEMLEMDIEEAEMSTIITESDDDEEMEDVSQKEIMSIITSKDKVKAAKQLEIIMNKKVDLPSDYYFAGVKSKDGDESISLRWKYLKPRPHGKTAQNVRSIMNIFGDGKDAIWVQDFGDDSLVKLPDEAKKLIETVLDVLEATKTNDPRVWAIVNSSDDDKKKDADADTDADDKQDIEDDPSRDPMDDKNTDEQK